MTASLHTLAERVEAASGADREMDAAIALQLRIHPEAAPWASKYSEWRQNGERLEVWDGQRCVGHWRRFPEWTASLDAAMTLVRDDWGWSLETRDAGFDSFVWQPGPGGICCEARAATPRLALSAAALRAIAAQGEAGKGRG